MNPRPAALQGDLSCFACGYNLRSQPLVGRCPECGLEVEETLQRRLSLEQRSDPRRTRRAAIFGIAAAAMPVAYMLINFLWLFVPLVDMNYRLFEFLAIGMAVVTTLCGGAFVFFAAHALRPEQQAGSISARILGLVGWAVPALIAALWVFGFLSDWGSQAGPPIVLGAMLLACLMGASLFPMMLLVEIRRRVLDWPIWQPLTTMMQIVLLGLGASLAGMWGLAALAFLESELELGLAEAYAPALSFLTGASALVFAAAMLGFVACLAATLLGLRRLRRLGFAAAGQQDAFDRAALRDMLDRVRGERLRATADGA